MKHHIDEHGRLVIEADPEDRAALNESIDEPDFDSDDFMHDALEWLVCNTEYDWVDPSVTGDLTDAPMLATFGDDRPGPDRAEHGGGLLWVGRWEHGGKLRNMFRPVLARYAFMSYQVTSPQRELAEKGRCVFEGGPV